MKKKVSEMNSPYESYWFCNENYTEHLNLHEDVIINSNNPTYILAFAEEFKKSNKEKLFNVHYINEFIQNIDLPQELKDLAIFI